jgi:hypothetical protein
MSSETEFMTNLEKVVNDNTGMDFLLVHGLLHDGLFEEAQSYAELIGVNLPPGELPTMGWPLTPEMKTFLQETLHTHHPGDSGLPDHEL